MQLYGEKAGLPPEKRKFHSLEHSIATHLLDARGELRFVQDWVRHKDPAERYEVCPADQPSA
jgi:site-specific recombinase XerC